jgi:hypothetical protein
MSLAKDAFFDDFSDPALARYYEITPGIGNVVRRADGLHYEIARAPGGSATAADCLGIDSLGRPQFPTTKVLVSTSLEPNGRSKHASNLISASSATAAPPISGLFMARPRSGMTRVSLWSARPISTPPVTV